MRRRRREAARAGTWISLRRTVAVVARARSVPVSTPTARVRLNVITASTSHAALAVNTPDGRCVSAEPLRSAWACSMTACPRWVLSADTVSSFRVGGGEEGMEPPGVEQGVLSGAVCRGVEVRDPSHHQPTLDVVGPALGGERGEADLGDLGPRDPDAGVLVEHGVGVLDRRPRLVGQGRDRG